jgi:hypothetical protein
MPWSDSPRKTLPALPLHKSVIAHEHLNDPMNHSMTAWAFFIALLLLCAGCGKSTPTSVASNTETTLLEETNCDFSQPIIRPLKKPREFTPGPELAGKTPRDPKYLLAWHRFTTVEEYKRIGRKNPAWDKDAIAALEAYAALVAGPELQGPAEKTANDRVVGPVSIAISARCDDPLIRYIYANCVIDGRDDVTPEQLDKGYGSAADALAASDYPSLRKADAFYCASQAFVNLRTARQKSKPRYEHLMRGSIHYYCEALLDKSMPPRHAYAACRSMLHEFTDDNAALRQLSESLLPTLENSWKDHAFAQYTIGSIYVAKAWQARNLAVSSSDDDPRRKSMREDFRKAEEYLKKSFEIDPTDWRVPVKMINVLTPSDQPRGEMEKWFDRAMAIDPDSYDAAWAKAYYLEPRWRRERDGEAALTFARECVESKKWAGHVPLVLPHLHANLQQYYKIDFAAYYSDPKVWKDIDTAYKRFFELNPDAVGYRHDYARDAYRAKQYKVFLEQLPLFTAGTNYDFFGSKASFQSMVQLASAKASR